MVACGMTQVRKEANRLTFGSGEGSKSEYGDMAMGEDYGRLGEENVGALRVKKKNNSCFTCKNEKQLVPLRVKNKKVRLKTN